MNDLADTPCSQAEQVQPVEAVSPVRKAEMQHEPPVKVTFPRTETKGGSEDVLNAATIAESRERRSDSMENAFSISATIPINSGSSVGAAQDSGRGRPKSRSRNAAKIASLSAAHGHQQISSGVLSNSESGSEATIIELQQRLETMAREKVTLENAIEQEQERMFNQSRRLSGTLSPAGLLPVGSGAIPGPGVGAVSPRWTKSHSRSSSVSSFGGASVSSVGITETLKADINSLRLRLADAERELVSCYNQSQIYKKELVSLRQRLGMSVDDLYMDDPVPSTIRPVLSDHTIRPRRSQSVSSGSTPSLVRRGSGHQTEYFSLLPSTAASVSIGGIPGSTATAGTGGTSTTPRRMSQRPRSVLLSPRRSMDDHHGPLGTGADSVSLFASKPAAGPPHRSSRNFK
ncbi:hypothetical protein H4R99_005120 [Coemansia sp. RSA 1722]|nr:hypothetical protein IWW45_006110 [Coemansia sp. RSA 485]KAJ2595955.1 hypothetical protein H4R99_005120 [Coemansia sp. RSA 1722]